MKFIADLHIHSHFSRATSKSLNPENLAIWAQKKGISVIGTGDFTHPGWVSELEEKLVECDDGLFQLKTDIKTAIDTQVPPSCLDSTKFLLSGEISCIYKKNGKTRKVHHLILMPDMKSLIRLNERLEKIGNIRSDGRPILGLDSRDLLEITLEASDRAFFIPAHVWTPWFSVFGSKSGFDTIDECFEDLTSHITALETGLSSDPPMNRLLSQLDDYILVSNSDAHSQNKLGREANLFDTIPDYRNTIRAMTDGNGFLGTIEFFPEEGKYHLDGHRKCQVTFQPEETMKHGGACPKCGSPVTVGVLNRILELSDRSHPQLKRNYFSLVPLTEILSEILNCGPASKKVAFHYETLLSKLGPELKILMDRPIDIIEKTGGPLIAEAIRRMRNNQVIREAGYDGQYGMIRLFNSNEITALGGQLALFKPAPKKAVAKKSDRTPFSNHPQLPKNVSADNYQAKPVDPILDPLNKEQKSVVLHKGGHILVVAGPGTGKTRTLTHRIAYLIRENYVRPDQILALTFTRKAAEEMLDRLSHLLEKSVHSLINVSTFHGFCLEILKKEGHPSGLRPDFAICAASDVGHLVRDCLSRAGFEKKIIAQFLKLLTPIKIAAACKTEKTPFKCLPRNVMPIGTYGPELQRCLNTYQSRLKELGMMDLDDLEIELLNVSRKYPGRLKSYGEQFSQIFIDEYQDTNIVQVSLLKQLLQNDPGILCAIGDPDQAIYGFRGAIVDSFHSFPKDFPESYRITLTRNYRSTQNILNASAAIMKKQHPLKGNKPENHFINLAPCRTNAEEAEMIVEHIERLIGGITHFSLDSGRVSSHEGDSSLSFGDIGILYRLNNQGDAIQEAMERAGIPFVRSGQSPLTARYPISVLWRFLLCRSYPANGFYKKMYDDALVTAGLDTLADKKKLETIHVAGPIDSLIDQIVKLHQMEVSTEDTKDALRIFKQAGMNFQGDISDFLDALSLERGIDHAFLTGDRVFMMSLHAAKGLEWPVVFVTGCEDQLLPCTLFGNRDDAEERRLLYVGMTRARSHLILSHVKTRTHGGRVLHMNPSPFIELLPKSVYMPLERRGWKSLKNANRQLSLFS